VRFEISATNGTGTCFEDATETVGQECDFTPQGNTPADPYVPGYTGAVFTLGADHIGGSHFQYSNQNVEMWNR
jgi:hypothetical protein